MADGFITARDHSERSDLNIVILHCHFERGGVTQVVENHVRSLCERGLCERGLGERGLGERGDVDRIVLVSGDRISGLSSATREAVEHVVLPDFDYDAKPWKSDSLAERSQRICCSLLQQFESRGMDPSDSILHWHNHSLGKNTAAPEVIRLLAGKRWRLLLQIHDFAEDSRPENYLRLINAIDADEPRSVDRYLYPLAPQIHYCTLTRADARALGEIGIPKQRVSYLPNTVLAPAGDSASSDGLSRDKSLAMVRQVLGLPSDARWCLYPVRGIRRKNVGEFLLISQLAPEDCYFGLTLCPATPVERRSYQRWKRVAPQFASRALFDVGQHAELPFVNSLLASEYVLSTSVAEGFGMAFLEPWLLRREVIARRLANVADDFVESGMTLSKFYDSIAIPGTPDWLARCHEQYARSVEQAWGRLPERFRPSLTLGPEGNDAIDFARLVPSEQVRVLQRISEDASFRHQVLERSSQLVTDLRTPMDPKAIELNGKIVQENYSPAVLSERLMSLYQALIDTPIDQDSSFDDHDDAGPRIGIAVERINRTRPFYPCRTEELASERT